MLLFCIDSERFLLFVIINYYQQQHDREGGISQPEKPKRNAQPSLALLPTKSFNKI
nr:MAG TPA: hypothetical protein [Caudoviricetes sp.]